MRLNNGLTENSLKFRSMLTVLDQKGWYWGVVMSGNAAFVVWWDINWGRKLSSFGVSLFSWPSCSATFCLVTLWGKYVVSSRGVGTEWDCSKTNLWIIVDDPLKLLGSSSVSKLNKSANFWLRNCTYSFVTHFIGHFLCLELSN